MVFFKYFHILDSAFVGIGSQCLYVTEDRFILRIKFLDSPICFKPHLITYRNQNVDKAVLKEESFVWCMCHLLIITYSGLNNPRIEVWRDCSFIFSKSVHYSSARDHSVHSRTYPIVPYFGQLQWKWSFPSQTNWRLHTSLSSSVSFLAVLATFLLCPTSLFPQLSQILITMHF
jgi:hypothetical protein